MITGPTIRTSSDPSESVQVQLSLKGLESSLEEPSREEFTHDERRQSQCKTLSPIRQSTYSGRTSLRNRFRSCTAKARPCTFQEIMLRGKRRTKAVRQCMHELEDLINTESRLLHTRPTLHPALQRSVTYAAFAERQGQRTCSGWPVGQESPKAEMSKNLFLARDSHLRSPCIPGSDRTSEEELAAASIGVAYQD